MHIPEGAKHVASSTAKNFLFETLTSAAGSFLSSFFEPIKQKAGEMGGAVGKEAVKKLFSEFRDEMFAWIHGQFAEETKDATGVSKAHENFNRRWRLRQLREHKPYEGSACRNFNKQSGKCDRGSDCLESYNPGDEIVFVAVWTGAYKHLSDETESVQRLNLFQYYFMLGDKEFDIEMEQLVHDVVKQYGEKFYGFIRTGFLYLKEGWDLVEPIPTYALEKGADFLEKIPAPTFGQSMLLRAISGAVAIAIFLLAIFLY